MKSIKKSVNVFIHSSIKTRIETSSPRLRTYVPPLFLYIVPLKQGLKLFGKLFHFHAVPVFIHSSIKTRIETFPILSVLVCEPVVFIHSSIKTRIETGANKMANIRVKEFLYIVPLKQGLKLHSFQINSWFCCVFIHSSIKTRIETSRQGLCLQSL